MRLFLLPLTNNRTLLYCQRIHVATAEKQGIVDKVTNKAAKLWSTWEKKDSGWQRKVVDYGNHALRRIPYEEWGLKSVPPLSARKKEMEVKGNATVELHYPQSIIPTSKAESLIMRLATERDALHRKRLTWSIVGMPLSAPFALIPVIPNLPFFYLVYRAWSHWRALAGGDHLEFLVKNKLLALSPSKILDDIYNPLLPSDPAKRVLTPPAQTGPLEKEPELSPDEAILLTQQNGRKIAEALELPELEVEMERAIWQINRAKQKMNDKQDKGGSPSTYQKEDHADTKKKP